MSDKKQNCVCRGVVQFIFPIEKFALTMILFLMIFSFVGAGGQVVVEQGLSSQTNSKSSKKIKVTFIELGSIRCIPCKKMMPIMKEIEEDYGDQVQVVFHDVWTEVGKPYAVKYGVKLIPTQIFLDEKGNEYFRHVGFFPKEQLLEVLQKKGVKLVKNKTKKEQAAKND